MSAIRTARPAEIQAVLDVWARARSAAARTTDDAAVVQRLMEREGSALLVAEDDEGEIIGTLVAGWDGWRGNMYRLAVVPEARRQGIGRRLVQHGHEWLRAQGARRVTALVAHDEEDATGLWRALGYERDQYIVRYVRDL